MANEHPEKVTFTQRLQYWINHYLIRSTKNMVITLMVMTLLIVFVLAMLLFIAGDDSLFAVLWDTFATTINAWMPYAEEGSVFHLIVTAIGAFTGILFTSFLIGILTTAVEDKLTELRTGNSKVIESNHYIIMGLHTGLYRMIDQLIQAADGRKQTIVVAGSEDRISAVEKIQENVDIPKNMKVRYRCVDVCDPVGMECLSLPTAGKILMNHGDDVIAMKCLLAISSITKQYQKRPSIVAIIHDSSNIPAFRKAGTGHNMLTLQSHKLISKIIAYTCMQPGLSYVFEEIFGCEGLEFYFDTLPACDGITFEELSQRMVHGIPIGYTDSRGIHINPDGSEVYHAKRQCIYLAEKKDSYTIDDNTYALQQHTRQIPQLDFDSKTVLMVCMNDAGDEITKELELLQCKVILVQDRKDFTYECLSKLCRHIQHVILLGDSEELTDDEIIRLILIMKMIREDGHANFNITAKMQDEKNKQLIQDEHTDFVIASDFSNMVMAQVADSPKRLPIFRELLSLEGNEISVIPIQDYVKQKVTMTVRDLRVHCIQYGMILLGIRTDFNSQRMLDDPQESITLTPNSQLIVIVKDARIM